MEDTQGQAAVFAEHGLSLYIETAGHKLLMDTGASEKTADNAARLGIDLSGVDTVILSHGHYDHTGGLLWIAELAPDAELYLQKAACGQFYHGEKYIGIDRRILDLPHLHLLDGDSQPDAELSLFTCEQDICQSGGGLTEYRDGAYVPDTFCHEQSLVITENGRRILLSGCAHCGIVNILARFRARYHAAPDAVVSGFHMPQVNTLAERLAVEETARELVRYPTVYYTGHCTGHSAFELLRPTLGTQLRRLHSGDELIL